MKYLTLGPRTSDIRPRHAGSCHNCQASVTEKYCGQCGQSAKLHIASAHEFLHHFIGHYVAAEGKLWRTLGLLLGRPGQLTLEYIRGRRTRYIDPLRLLLTVSLLVFSLMKLPTYLGWQEPVQEKPAKPVAARSQVAPTPTTPLVTRMIFAAFEHASPSFAGNRAAFDALPSKQRGEKFAAIMQRQGPAIFLCLVPLFALYLKLLHLGTGWHYGEHLLAAIHLTTSFLLAFLLYSLVSVPWLEKAVLLGFACHLLLAMRRVYAANWLLTVVRGVTFMFAGLWTFVVSLFVTMLATLL